eukprot:325277-Hanusia_phi.AAC.1
MSRGCAQTVAQPVRHHLQSLTHSATVTIPKEHPSQQLFQHKLNSVLPYSTDSCFRRPRAAGARFRQPA